MREYFNKNKNTILEDLQCDGGIFFKIFTRMSLDDFTIILNLIRPEVSKRNTVMREAIPAEIRLAITIRYLATRDSYVSLSFLFMISKKSIMCIICESVRAINGAIKDCMKVCSDTNNIHVLFISKGFVNAYKCVEIT